MKKGLLVVGVSSALACTSSANIVVNTYPDWDGSVTNGWVAIAQSFTAPSDNVLDNWMFALAPLPGGQNSVTFNIYAWSDLTGPVGSSLYSSVEAWPAGGGDVLVDNIALSLTPGNLYAAVVHLQGYSGLSVQFQFNQFSYTDGDASWLDGGTDWHFLNSGWNTKFRAEFVPEPSTPLILTFGAAGLLIRRR
jgi:hypothetical protein